MALSTHFTGRAGEYAVASQLLIRGIPVHFPAVDTGVDLIVGERLRVQVKSSRVRRRDAGGYVFTLTSRTPKDGHKQYSLKCRDWGKAVDFMVFWGITENRFWIIPSGVFSSFRQVQTLLLGSAQHRTQVDRAKVHELFKSGMRQSDIARLLSLSPMCVCETLRRAVEYVPLSVCVEADKYENAWEEIVSAVTLAGEIDSDEAVADLAAQET